MKLLRTLYEKDDTLEYEILDDDGKKLDTFKLKHYSYKEKIEMFVALKIAETLRMYKYNDRFKANDFHNMLFDNTGIRINIHSYLDLRWMKDISEILFNIEDYLYGFFDSMESSISIRMLDKKLDVYLNYKIEKLPETIVNKIKKFEEDNNLSDMFKELLYLCAEKHYEFGYLSAGKFESEMKRIAEIAEEFGATSPDEE